MIKTKFNPILFPVFALLTILPAGREMSPDDLFFSGLAQKLRYYHEHFFAQKAYLMTDRFVYRAGEDLWFKGYVTVPAYGSTQSFGDDYFIKLLNTNGEEIIYRRYPLIDNQSEGRLLIPKSTIPGKYWLVAYSGWMKNQCPREVYRKEILVSRYFEKRFHVEVLYDKLVYAAGDTLSAVAIITDPAGKVVPNVHYEYSVGTFGKTEIRGTGNTDVKGKTRIQFEVPTGNGIMMLGIAIRNRRYSGDYTLLIPTSSEKPVVEFFPESGNLVIGMENTLAIKAMNPYGLPEMIRGEITDASGNVLHRIRTGVNGLATFMYTPGIDTSYLKIDLPENPELIVALPMAQKEGTIMRLMDNNADSADLYIASTGNQHRTQYLVAVSESQIVWNYRLSYSGDTLVTVPLVPASTGIMQVSLFDSRGILLADRLIKAKTLHEALAIKTDHQIYRSRQRVNVLIEYPGNSKVNNLAMSVSLDRLASNRSNRDFYQVINADPCDTISPSSLDSKSPSDIELLTTHYKIVDWSEVLVAESDRQPYVRHNGLSGRVTDKKENTAQLAKIRVTHFPNYRSYETQSDETGYFNVLFGTDIVDFKYLNIEAYDATGKTSLNAETDQVYAREVAKTLTEDTKHLHKLKVQDLLTYGEPDLVYELRYGPGKFRKTAKESRKKYDPNQYANYTDVIDIIQDIKPCIIRDNKIFFTENRQYIDSVKPGEAIIVINGSLKGNQANMLRSLIPSDITNINISQSLLDIHKYTPLNFGGVIEITTIQGMYRYRQPQFQMGTNILNSGREFYLPDYSLESSASSDNRKTLYWNPKIVMNKANVVLISFYTSDIKGIFQGHLTGIDADGNPVERYFRFRVE